MQSCTWNHISSTNYFLLWCCPPTLNKVDYLQILGCNPCFVYFISVTYSTCSDALVTGLANDKLTASSTYSSYYDPYRAKMSELSAWCTKKDDNNMNQWLMVDLGVNKIITGLATKGYATRQTTSLFIEYSKDQSSWSTYQEESKDKVRMHGEWTVF